MADGKAAKASMDGIWKALGIVLLGSVLSQLTMLPDVMQQIASEINKMKRPSLICTVTMSWWL